MKYHITPKQAKDVSEEEFYSIFNEIVPRKDWANYHHKKMDIGKMIDFLDEVTIGKSIVDGNWNLFVDEKHYEGKELVDILWGAVKDVLNE